MEQENLINQRQEPVISQVQPYKLVQIDHVEHIVKTTAKGKGNVVGIHISEP